METHQAGPFTDIPFYSTVYLKKPSLTFFYEKLALNGPICSFVKSFSSVPSTCSLSTAT